MASFLVSPMCARRAAILIIASTTLAAGAASALAKYPTAPASDYQPDPASVIREGAAYRYTQAGWIVLHIEGEPYERGYQHGKLLAAEIADLAKSLATARSPKSPGEAWRDLRTLVNALFMRRYDDEYLREMKGIADGAAAAGAKFETRPIDLLDVVVLNSNIEVEFLNSGLEATATGLEGHVFEEPADGQEAAEPEDHCSAFAATGPATADGQIVFGHITMSQLYAVRHYNVWLDIKPKAGHRVVCQTSPGGIMSGVDYYLNDAGLLCSETTITQTRFHVAGDPLASRIRRVMQYADSIDKAVEILLSSNNGLYSNEWLLADIKTNEIAMFELGTHKHKLWRSSKHEFPGGTEGFYWGCNNTKDLAVRQETAPSLQGKPANMVFRPHDRDVTWQRLFREDNGKIDANFGFKAFTTPPLAAFPSCDAKFTTTALAKEMKSWALFGPPLGRTWDATPEESRRLPDIKPLVANDWALLTVTPPATPGSQVAKAVDLAPFQKDKADAAKSDRRRVLPPAWHGTLLPATDGDAWLAAAFSDYEKIVSLENSLRKKAKGKELDKEAKEKLAVAQFAPYSRWLAATRRNGGDAPLAQIQSQWDKNEWYAIAAGKGVMLLSALRAQIGGETFDKAMDAFGRAHAGQEVSTAAFREHLEKSAGRSLASVFDAWLAGKVNTGSARENFWSIDSFEVEPEHALIVYGTLEDVAAQREAAELLQRKIARRFSNFNVPIKSDTEATADDLKNHHVLCIGRPSTNRVTAQLAEGLTIRFGEASFTTAGETYAHADSAVVAAGGNRQNDRYSIVVYAGLGARATRACVEGLPNRGGETAEVMLMPNGVAPKALRITTPSVASIMP